jgi:hypothetical protein
MSVPKEAGCVGPEILIETTFCGVGDMLLVVYGIAAMIAVL